MILMISISILAMATGFLGGVVFILKGSAKIKNQPFINYIECFLNDAKAHKKAI